jgi:hypothetical protein
MQYLLLIYGSEGEWEKVTPTQEAAIHQEYRQLIQELLGKGKFLGGSQLKRTSMATTVRVRDGKPVVTDGPFAEIKEQLGGYFLVEANDLDEALAIAARIPSARTGMVEVRPLVVSEQARQASSQ